MAKRPIFLPTIEGEQYTQELLIEFEWHAGFSLAQKQKTIASLHAAAERNGLSHLLEISTKSPRRLGRELSAFNLLIVIPDLGEIPTEVAFQGSKVFERGGPFTDLYGKSPRDAKRDTRLRESGTLRFFQFQGEQWPLEPKTLFYDWLYLQALQQNTDLAEQLHNFQGFTDIEFNPQRSINCQARAAALYVSLTKRGELSEALESSAAFRQKMTSHF